MVIALWILFIFMAALNGFTFVGNILAKRYWMAVVSLIALVVVTGTMVFNPIFHH